MAEAKKKDPAGGSKGKAEDKVQGVDLDFKPIPMKTEKIPRPFDGYPLMTKVNLGGFEVSGTYVVALNPTVLVRQDPSNKKVKQKDGTFKQVQNAHSRFVRDYEEGDNTEIVFDRELEIKGKSYFCAYVPSHNVRAQICFFYDSKAKRVKVDQKYLLLDTGQSSRLRQVFDQVINPKLKVEREAAFIAGEEKESDGETKPLTEEDI